MISDTYNQYFNEKDILSEKKCGMYDLANFVKKRPENRLPIVQILIIKPIVFSFIPYSLESSGNNKRFALEKNIVIRLYFIKKVFQYLLFCIKSKTL